MYVKRQTYKKAIYISLSSILGYQNRLPIGFQNKKDTKASFYKHTSQKYNSINKPVKIIRYNTSF